MTLYAERVTQGIRPDALCQPLPEADFGVPVASPTVRGYTQGKAQTGLWTREWSKATISLNCSTSETSFAFK